MIEQIAETLINELGATGLLILAFAWIHHNATKKIVSKLGFINDELSQIIKLMWKQENRTNKK